MLPLPYNFQAIQPSSKLHQSSGVPEQDHVSNLKLLCDDWILGDRLRRRVPIEGITRGAVQCIGILLERQFTTLNIIRLAMNNHPIGSQELRGLQVKI